MTTVLHYNDILPEGAKTKNDFEQTYIALRGKEQRIYTDEEVSLLPDIPREHIHYKEWQIRKRSAKRLTNYLAKKNTVLKILEIGCGNGWLSSKLSEIKNSKVIGMDINRTEVVQAEKVFNKGNLRFLNAGIKNDELPKNIFDIVVFAASIQYFKNIQNAIEAVYMYLVPVGEIHILDTKFYDTAEIESASDRSVKYYTDMGFPEMGNHYFHHSWNDLKGLDYKILYNPAGFINRIIGKADPFPWLKIRGTK